MEKSKWKAMHDVAVLKDVSRDTMLQLQELHLTYPARNTRYQPAPGELALLLHGRARVCRRDGSKIVLLSSLTAGDCVGLASLYSDSLPDTEVSFAAGAVLLVIPRYLVEQLIETDAVFSRNIICELSKKVRFLNTKIAGYTAGSMGEKLYRHLLNLPRDEEGYVTLSESMASLARRLGIGRASLYRAVDSLQSEGKIEKEGQRMRLLPSETQED